ncbi:hypothetical protein Scep_006257 [Stephania cephalantha]|uniref:procollagen-proline 4-dioxygenase n=1 Tax=Stephania cephalantha TaxID=152367 RepID=A0AAP0K8V8_9MAGN
MASLLPIYLILASLSPISTYSSVSYRKGLRAKDDNNQEFIEQVGRAHQFLRVDPSRVVQLSWHPRSGCFTNGGNAMRRCFICLPISLCSRVFLYRGFLSDEECDHLISLKDHESGSTADSVTALSKGKDEIVGRVEERISGWTFLPKENSQGMQILHYGPEQGNQHLGYYGDKSGEPLMATVILYLSNVTEGGETLFPESENKRNPSNEGTFSDCAKTGYAVKPVKGNALLFFNLQPNTVPDKRSSSARCPVLWGEKWCATKFFHIRSLENKKVSVDSDDNGCTDEDDNCFQWAAMGECQKNPVYMIGTPDYYGACRKSCKVC